jgi:predicted O-methyltransferase YrrM
LVNADEISETPSKLAMDALNVVYGNVTELELVLISSFVHRTSPQNCFEIGTFDGRTTLNMALNSPPEAHVFTLDLPVSEIENTQLPIDSWEKAWINKERSGARFVAHSAGKKITQLYGDSANFDFSPYLGKMDLVFVDASHAYEYVKNDSLVAFRLLRNGRGVILWHDYNAAPGVTRALNELYENDSRLRHIKGTALAYLDCTV